MLVPTAWLKTLVDYPDTTSELADRLTRLGLGVESIHPAPGGLGGDVLELEITPNRGDCLSLLGVAREVAAATGVALTIPDMSVGATAGSIEGTIHIVVEDPDLCPRYAARMVTGITNGPSPRWLQERLLACGQRPINLLVDVTNYVLFELGQPLHAFDRRLLGETIVVRRARENEPIVTLDGTKRTLTTAHLVITDGQRPVALAGVMGGANTEVQDDTSEVLLEAAHFYGPNIRRTARSLGLDSESSYRFARTVDPNLPLVALDRAAQLLAELGGGTVVGGVIDVASKPFDPVGISLRPARCNSFLGTDLTAREMADYLIALGLDVAPFEESAKSLEVRVPTRRPDLEREVDLIEEIARLHGYDNVEVSVPPPAHRTGRLTVRQQLERRVRELLLGSGLHEVWTFSLTSPEAMAKGAMAADRDAIGAIELQNPLSEEFSVMRWSMLPSMLEVVGRNLSVGAEAVRIFELGRTYARLNRDATDQAAAQAGRLTTGRTATSLPLAAVEERTLAGALTGRLLTSAWNLPAPPEDALFYEAKGVLELVLAELRLEGVSWEPCEESIFEPGRAARALRDGQVFCVLGEVSPAVRDRYDIRGELVVFELNLGWLLDTAATARVYQPLPRQPAALRDLALVAAETVPAGGLEATIRLAAGPWLESLALFDVYRGKGMPAGTRSLGYNLRFRHPDRTLTDGEVDGLVAAVIEAVSREHDARLRE